MISLFCGVFVDVVVVDLKLPNIIGYKRKRNVPHVQHAFNCRALPDTNVGSQGGLVVINRAPHLCDPRSTLASR